MKNYRRKRTIIAAFSFLAFLLFALFYRSDNVLTKINNALLAPSLSVTKTGALDTSAGGDLNNNGIVNPGDRLNYTITIQNSGSNPATDTATGVTLSDTIDANTTLVSGSAAASPIAVNESYSSIGNLGISVPDGANDLLSNDLDANNPGVNTALVITSAPTVSANGGNVLINTTTGAFTYNPPAGFEGTDTFTYTLSNGTGLNDTATVTIQVSGMIWFINASAGVGGDGRFNSPFNCFVGTNCFDDTTLDEAGDSIFLYSGNYAGGQTLLNNQKLIGQGASATLAEIAGIATIPPFSNALSAMGGTNPTITTTVAATNAINLGQNNTIRGITIGNTTGSKLNALATVGTLMIGPVSGISDVTLNGTGQALSLTGGGTLAARFASVSSDSGATGITLTGMGGSLESPTTNIQNSVGIGISVSNSVAGGTFNFGATTSNSSAGTGVSLTGTANSIIFADLDITPDSGQRGFYATNNTGTITTTSGTINTTNQPAVEIVGTSAANRTPINITFDSVSSNGAANGILVQNTSNGGTGFRIIGNGSTDGSGGTISNITNRGASFINANDISLSNMTFANVGTTNGADPAVAHSTCGDLGPLSGGNSGCNAGIHFDTVTGAALSNVDLNGGNQVGINGNNLSNFTLTNSNVLNFGNQVREDGLKFRNLLGTSSITGTTISGNEAVQVHVENISGTLTSLTITNTVISTSAAPNGSHGILFDTHSTATGKLIVQGVTFSNLFSNCIDALSESSSGGLEVVVNGDPTGANLRNSFTGCGASAITIAQNGAAPVRFNIFNNGTAASPTFLGGNSSSAININQAGSTPQSANMQGAITGNFIGNTNSPTSSTVGGDGIAAATIAPGTLTVAINNNRIRGVGANGIRVQMSEETNNAQRLNLTLLNNDALVTNDPNGFDGIRVQAGALAGDAGTLCAEINNNDGGTVAAGNDFTVRNRFVTTFQLRGYGGANNSDAAV